MIDKGFIERWHDEVDILNSLEPELSIDKFSNEKTEKNQNDNL